MAVEDVEVGVMMSGDEAGVGVDGGVGAGGVNVVICADGCEVDAGVV